MLQQPTDYLNSLESVRRMQLRSSVGNPTAFESAAKSCGRTTVLKSPKRNGDRIHRRCDGTETQLIGLNHLTSLVWGRPRGRWRCAGEGAADLAIPHVAAWSYLPLVLTVGEESRVSTLSHHAKFCAVLVLFMS
jgi:hypothetical protein